MKPMCAKCGKEMTPENSKIHPEWFHHDACLPTLEDLKDVPVESLPEYLKTHPYKGPFKPIPTYSLAGDMLSLYLEDEPAFGDPINQQVTIMRAFSDKRIVGVKIYGINGMVSRAEFEANLAKKKGNAES